MARYFSRGYSPVLRRGYSRVLPVPPEDLHDALVLDALAEECFLARDYSRANEYRQFARLFREGYFAKKVNFADVEGEIPW